MQTVSKKKQQKNTPKSKTAMLFAYLEVIPYALIPLIWLVDFPLPKSLSGDIAKAVITTISKDFISAIVYLAIVTMKGLLPKTLALLKTKAGWLIVLAGIFGGPIGYTLFNATFFYVGPSYGHIFTATEPIIMIAAGILIFKRKYNFKAYIGIALVVLAIGSMIIGESLGNKEWWKYAVGALLGIAGALAWALEAILFDKAFDLYQDKDNTTMFLTLKMTFSLMFGFIVMMPLFSAIATGNAARDYEIFGSIFTTGDYLWRFILAGVLIVGARFMYFYALKYVGGTMTSVLYNLTVIATPLFALIYYAISGDMIDHSLEGTGGWVILGISLPLAVGTTLVSLNRPEINREQKIIQ